MPCQKNILTVLPSCGTLIDNFASPKLFRPALTSAATRCQSLQNNVAKTEIVFALSVVANSLLYTWWCCCSYLYLSACFQVLKLQSFKIWMKKLYLISGDPRSFCKSKVVEACLAWHILYHYGWWHAQTRRRGRVAGYSHTFLCERTFLRESRVITKHPQSFNLGHATAEQLFSCVKKALVELPNRDLLCLFPDGLNVMKSLRRKV